MAHSQLEEDHPSSSQYKGASPIRAATYGLTGRKEVRQPSITPRKFSRFFTPRSHGPFASKSTRRALFDITEPSNNRNGIQSSPIRSSSNALGERDEGSPQLFTREMKRRKLFHVAASTSDEDFAVADAKARRQSTPSSRAMSEDGNIFSSPCGRDMDKIGAQVALTRQSKSHREYRRIERLEDRGISGRLAQISMGSLSSRRRQPMYPVPDWQRETAGFYSRPEDMHTCTSVENLNGRCIPFCTASCNTNTLIAVGDEEGRIRLLESAKDSKPDFKDIYLAFRPHSNAIIDITFSQDDKLLATASGDQTACIIDMITQQTISVLALHTASVKQVKFQPGTANNSVVATSARDGNVHIWDLRCRNNGGPVHSLQVALDPASDSANRPVVREPTYGSAVSHVFGAHCFAARESAPQPNLPRGQHTREPSGRTGEVSVTSISFLPEGREHLLLTASEANASVKLWDIRSLHNARRGGDISLSSTALPASHNRFRHFGTCSMNLNSDGSRIFTLCKDNTVYAYSTAHLILGSAPELSMIASRPRPKSEERTGLGPLYGYRHPQLHATSFYVKTAVRPARGGNAEMLAVGSNDGCALLFPTDERYLPSAKPFLRDVYPDRRGSLRSRLNRTPNSGGGLARYDETMSISENGSPLIRGHDREVGAVAWTSEGELVTVGDDYIVRCWREGEAARDLRVGGEDEGRRWGCGWADVDSIHDEADDDDI